ncbi:hypothetical protein CHU98_g7073 [Xylaria longipes]|nr:hypothetical protein CHU98_g7073 [Xylaria longipes]
MPDECEVFGQGKALGTGDNPLLEQDRAETSVKGTDTFGSEDLAETIEQSLSIARCRDETDTGGFQGGREQ